ncbi:macro domain-containing protein [Shimia sp. CNT1-13L.2]|nr:macro domain-containing protein [Shimia sp. CNT1-13L.2]
MGKGIAKEFKKRDREMFKAYKSICDQKLLVPGKLWLWRRKTPWVLNFPTKNHWRGASKLEWIESGLDKFANTYSEKGITSISFPKLGCGNGGLRWEAVQPVMEKYLADIDIDVFIHDVEGHPSIPEHIEYSSTEIAFPTTFEEFEEALRDYATKNSKQTTLLSRESYSVRLDQPDCIVMTVRGDDFSVTQDDLRGLWLNLLNGRITHKEAEWFNTSLRGTLVDLVARLPFTSATLQSKNNEMAISVGISRETNGQTIVSNQNELI